MTRIDTDLWAPAKVAAYLGVPRKTLDRWAYRAEGPPFRKVGRHRRYRPEDVERWLQTRPAGGTQGCA